MFFWKQKQIDVVIGLGETGRPLFNILKKKFSETVGYDIKNGFIGELPDKGRDVYLHICIPHSDTFLSAVETYQNIFTPILTVIHSTVPIGTTAKIRNAVHSPILGRHHDMENSIYSFDKWIGGKKAEIIAKHFEKAGMTCVCKPTSELTEASKLMCLAKYGASLVFAQYQQEICNFYGFKYEDILEWDKNYNAHVTEGFQRPLLTPPHGAIGGHCVVQNTKLLNQQHPHAILDEIINCGTKKDYVVWQPSNVYKTALIGKGVSIGIFSEIGNHVKIGDDTRIGAMCFIPEGVIIGKGCFIGPRVTMTNDKYPPTGKEHWLKTIIEDGARVGAGATIVCGITIGKGALIGAGSVVTKDIPAGSKWSGVPARCMNKKA